MGCRNSDCGGGGRTSFPNPNIRLRTVGPDIKPVPPPPYNPPQVEFNPLPPPERLNGRFYFTQEGV